MSLFMEPFGSQSPKVLASTKGARVFFYGISRRLLTKSVCLHGPRDCSPHSLLVIYTLFDGPSEQLSSWCVRLMGRWVNRRPESKSRPLLARRGLSPTTVPTASSTARCVRTGVRAHGSEHSIAGTPAANLEGNDAWNRTHRMCSARPQPRVCKHGSSGRSRSPPE
jgi:hypothetical protein